MIVVITGVGGVGKTTVAKLLSKKLGWKRLYVGYDRKRKSWIVDMQKMKREMRKIERQEKDLIVESLYAHFFDAGIVAVLRCKPKVLEKRLKKKYSWHTKIAENREAEIIGLITQEAVEIHGRKKVFEFDTTNITPNQTATQIKRVIEGKNFRKKYKAGSIDWLDEAGK
jgi:adenylate kinase